MLILSLVFVKNSSRTRMLCALFPKFIYFLKWSKKHIYDTKYSIGQSINISWIKNAPKISSEMLSGAWKDFHVTQAVMSPLLSSLSPFHDQCHGRGPKIPSVSRKQTLMNPLYFFHVIKKKEEKKNSSIFSLLFSRRFIMAFYSLHVI